MEILALLFALSPIIVTLVFWVCKSDVPPSEQKAESTHQIFEEIAAPVAQMTPVAVAASVGASSEDEITVVLAAAANTYVKSIN